MPVLETKGALSAQGYGLTTSQPQRVFVEDVFSTWLYTGNGGFQTINNGIDLAGKGGLVWFKSRSAATDHALYDTARGATFDLASNLASAQTTQSTGLTGFLANGFSIGSLAKINTNAATYVSWTFREQPKFFDIVTYTGNGAASRNIPHNLGSVPGCIINKATSISDNWGVYHRSTGANGLYLNGPNSAGVTLVPTGHTSTTFEVADGFGLNNSNGVTYVAYLFAHDAGGFGATGADNVISCGSFTSNSGGAATVTLGYEPQWLLVKESSRANGWLMMDNMRGFTVTDDALLQPNTSGAEFSTPYANPTATGFSFPSGLFANSTFIYIAIRRGPMRTPTSGTSVFAPVFATSPPSPYTVTTNFPVDTVITTGVNSINNRSVLDRLRGGTTDAYTILTISTGAELSGTGAGIGFQNNTAVIDRAFNSGFSGFNPVYWNFRRAPGFFDVVCYTGNGGGARNLSMNLAARPELVFVKARSAASDWFVGIPFGTDELRYYTTLRLNSAAALGSLDAAFVYGAPFNLVGVPSGANTNGVTYVSYVFSSLSGVSQVGSYTGTGATQTINCGFSSGARFVLIKRTDSTGDWYVWDSARGIVAGNDPYLLLNSAAAEVTTTDWVDTAASGFELSNAAGNLVNTNGGSYIFLAIA